MEDEKEEGAQNEAGGKAGQQEEKFFLPAFCGVGRVETTYSGPDPS